MTARTSASPDGTGIPRPIAPARVIAHRGASGDAPENTLAAFRLAAAQGARWVEFDVSLLGDGTPVVWHDETLERCSDRTGPLAELAAGDLPGIDAGSWFGPAFAGEPMATLADALDLIGSLGLGANLEMKAHGKAPGPLADAVAAALTSRDWTSARMTVSSFDHGELLRLRARMPGMPLAVLYEEPAADWRDFLGRVGAEAIHLHYPHLDAGLLAAARADGRAVRVYTVNDPAIVLSWRERGLAGVFTDHPGRFLADPAWAAWDAVAHA